MIYDGEVMTKETAKPAVKLELRHSLHAADKDSAYQ